MSTPYFEETHEHVRHDYRAKEGGGREACSFVALKMAELLLAEGHDPHIFALRGEDEGGHRKPLTPLPFAGRVIWSAHIICEANNLVYDPILPQPTPMQEYLCTMFAQPLDIEDHSDILMPPPEHLMG